MFKQTQHSLKHNLMALCLISASTITLSGCGNTLDRLENIGSPPKLSQINNPVERDDYYPITMPMPLPKTASSGANSLWQPRRQHFFEDQRAGDVGDILTVVIDIDDAAAINNKTERSRTNGEDANLGALMGLEASLDRVFPQAIVNTDLIDMTSSSSNKGDGKTERDEKIELRLAAIVSQILPNGNFAVYGRQEVVVNFEKRLLSIQGIIRPEDISRENTVTYDQIAEARITYGGEGQITDVQQPRYGQQLYDVLFPF